MTDNSDLELQEDKPIANPYVTPEQAKIAKAAVETVDKLRLERAQAIEDKRNSLGDDDQTIEVRKKLEAWAKFQNEKQPVEAGATTNDSVKP